MVYGDFIAKTYQQQGETIAIENLLNNLETLEKTQVSAQKSKRWSYLISPAAAAGVVVAISALVDNNLSNSGSDGRLVAGLGLIGISLLSAHFAQKHLDQAVEQFNQKFPALPQPEPAAEPNESGFFHFDFVPEKNDVTVNLIGGWHF